MVIPIYIQIFIMGLKSIQIFIEVLKFEFIQISIKEAIKFMFIQISIMVAIVFIQISIRVFIQISIRVFIQIFTRVLKFVQTFTMVFEIIQIFIREVIRFKSMFDRISITFNIKALFLIVLFLLKNMKVIGIANTRVSTKLIKLIKEEYK